MRILVVGAGGIGGYFGGRLLEAGRDVTFLLRARRASELARTGLTIRSPRGDAYLPAPPAILADQINAPFDLILLSCKAYDLEGAMDSFAPVVGPHTIILPLLNGMSHIDKLETRFGSEAVFGGQCLISAATDAEGRILHLNETHLLSFGERDGARSARAEAVLRAFSAATFEAKLSEGIVQEMWDKWVFIATGAAMTCLMRASVGDIVTTGGTEFATRLLDECIDIATRCGHRPSEASVQRSRATFTAADSPLTASMLRDIERGAPIEADHVVGDLLNRSGGESPLLRLAYRHLKAYEARRTRQASTAKAA